MKYCIREGKKDYRPRDSFQIGKIKKDHIMIYEFVFSVEGAFDYIDPETGILDNDWHDWKKGGGLSLWNVGLDMINMFRLDRDNVMWAWRYNPIRKTYEFTAYSNSKGKKRVSGVTGEVVMSLPPDSVGWAAIYHHGDNSKVYLGKGKWPGSPSGGLPTSFDHRKGFSCYRVVGLYYGGKNNAEGIWGGKAPLSHCHEVGKGFVKLVENT